MASLKTAAFDEDVVMEPITFDVAINVSQDVGDIALEAVVPRSAIYRMSDTDIRHNEHVISELKSGWEYRAGWGWNLITGSRAEGLTLDNYWGHENADENLILLHGGALGVCVDGGQQPRGGSCLDFCSEGCPPGYCKLQISDLNGLMKSEVFCKKWLKYDCIEGSDSAKWLNMHHVVDCIRNCATDNVINSEPAKLSHYTDRVDTLVCSDPHPDLHNEFRNRTRGPWPTANMINDLLQLPMILVPVEHKRLQEFKFLAKMSWSHLECKLIKELPEKVRQGYIACKYIFVKRFAGASKGQNLAGDDKNHIGSHHIKCVFLHFLDKYPPSSITSPFKLFLDLLTHLQDYLQVGKRLPHYFQAQCDLLESVGNDERHLAIQVIKEILLDPLQALLTSPTRPKHIYGEVHSDRLVKAFQKVSDDPMCEQSRNELSELLLSVDKRRLDRFREQQEEDDREMVYGRTALTGLVGMLQNIKMA